MKKILVSLYFFLLSTTIIKADVIFFPISEFGINFSFELIASYEIPFSQYNTISFWGGGGVVFPIYQTKNPAIGTEIALEIRHYFKNQRFSEFNLGLYAGLAYMHAPYFYGNELRGYEDLFGIVPGIKLTYKQNVKNKMIIEPYVSISIPWYNDLDSFKQNDWLKYSEPGLIFTIGARFGLNYIKSKIKSQLTQTQKQAGDK